MIYHHFVMYLCILDVSYALSVHGHTLAEMLLVLQWQVQTCQCKHCSNVSSYFPSCCFRRNGPGKEQDFSCGSNQVAKSWNRATVCYCVTQFTHSRFEIFQVWLYLISCHSFNIHRIWNFFPSLVLTCREKGTKTSSLLIVSHCCHPTGTP